MALLFPLVFFLAHLLFCLSPLFKTCSLVTFCCIAAGDNSLVLIVCVFLFQWVLVEQACNMYSMTIVPLYDTLGPESCAYIINQGNTAVKNSSLY